MRPFLRAALDCLVGNEPGVATASLVPAAHVRPASDVAFVLIWNAEHEPVDIDPAADSEMENVFVAIVQKSFRTDRLEVAKGPIVNGDRFDPMNRVLEDEEVAELKNN